MMKKLVVSALLVGLLLGTTAPVFAATGRSTIGTNVNGTISANYVVSIPTTTTVDLTDDSLSTNNTTIKLDSLTAAGSILVTPILPMLTLSTSENVTLFDNEKVGIELRDRSAEALTSFNLQGPTSEKIIKVVPTEESKDKIAGTYTGNITFTLDYVPAPPAADSSL
jgi:hypothetical protein